jgi:hypothetical protein
MSLERISDMDHEISRLELSCLTKDQTIIVMEEKNSEMEQRNREAEEHVVLAMSVIRKLSKDMFTL